MITKLYNTCNILIKSKIIFKKPDYKDAPTNFASIGRYIFTPEIFDILRDLPKGLGGEIQLADAINIHAQKGYVDSVALRGTRFDCGSIDGFIAASLHEYRKRKKV